MPVPEANLARITVLFERSLDALLSIAEDDSAPARERRLAATTVLQATGALPRATGRLSSTGRCSMPVPSNATTSPAQRTTTPTESPRPAATAPAAITPTTTPQPKAASPSPSHRITGSPSHEATPRAATTSAPAPAPRSPSLLSGFRDLYREVFPAAPIPGRHADKHPRDG